MHTLTYNKLYTCVILAPQLIKSNDYKINIMSLYGKSLHTSHVVKGIKGHVTEAYFNGLFVEIVTAYRSIIYYDLL